jgi:hypothetical protein
MGSVVLTGPQASATIDEAVLLVVVSKQQATVVPVDVRTPPSHASTALPAAGGQSTAARQRLLSVPRSRQQTCEPRWQVSAPHAMVAFPAAPAAPPVPPRALAPAIPPPAPAVPPPVPDVPAVPVAPPVPAAPFVPAAPPVPAVPDVPDAPVVPPPAPSGLPLLLEQAGATTTSTAMTTTRIVALNVIGRSLGS